MEIKPIPTKRTRAQESRAAIERLYIAMRHLFIRGSYKPLGLSGEAIIEALMILRPEIYGSITDPERVELEGLLYVFLRLPKGIEECRFVKLISREGYEISKFEPIVPPKRRRNCYRIDQNEMYIEMTRGRSDVYDLLTHLSFMYIESEKIRRNSENQNGQKKREWIRLKEIVEKEQRGEAFDIEVGYTYLSTLLGRTYQETVDACEQFSKSTELNSIFHITYWLGKLSSDEANENLKREITFSSALRERIGHHYYGELWAQNIKKHLFEKKLIHRPIHLISANLHSVMNCLFGPKALKAQTQDVEELAKELSNVKNEELRQTVTKYALKNGMTFLEDHSGSNIGVQIFDTSKFLPTIESSFLQYDIKHLKEAKPVIIVIDYAFGEQAYEIMDELLKPFEHEEEKIPINMKSISIMGKAGTLEGAKGDVLVPTAHIFEGTADNYPFENDLTIEDFNGNGLNVFQGPMITVLGTSLQNKDILRFFLKSSWKAIGLEMEGAHYQKAIQAASRIRKAGIDKNVKLRYAYYASDNPLLTGQTLASGGLGIDGVKPTYLITEKILNKIFLGI